MTERCCETCVHYPPSSFGGKPCSCCNPDDPMTSCWDGRPEGENDCSDSNGYYILGGELLHDGGELLHDLETILDLCANYAGCHTGPVEGAFSEIEDMLGSLIFDIKQHQATDVVPVRRGRWVSAKGSWITPGGDPVWECSECGKGRHVFGIEHGSYGLDVADGQWVSCPNCAAKMEESDG